MCARTSVHTRFRPRVLRSAFSFSSLPSPRSFLPPFSLLPRAPPSIDLAHREPSPPILYTSSIFLRTLPFISCSSAREILSVFRPSIYRDHGPTSSGSLSLFSLFPPPPVLPVSPARSRYAAVVSLSFARERPADTLLSARARLQCCRVWSRGTVAAGSGAYTAR